MESFSSHVYVVDDDAELRESVAWVLNSVGYWVHAFATADEFLAHPISTDPFCLIADLLLPGTTGLNLCREITSRYLPGTFVLISGYGDIPSAVEAMRIGAIDFLEKPFSRQRLLDAVSCAIQKAQAVYQDRLSKGVYFTRMAKLTVREQEVLQAVASGLVTKEIARRLSISARTVTFIVRGSCRSWGSSRPCNWPIFLQFLAIRRIIPCLRNRHNGSRRGEASAFRRISLLSIQ